MKVYKFRSEENMEFIYDILVNKQVYCSKYRDLNDPFEGQFDKLYVPQFGTTQMGSTQMGGSRKPSTIDDTYDLDDLRICSFARSYDDVRLWSYYANSHKGICIEFETDDALLGNEFYIVAYESALKAVTSQVITKEIAINILRRKSEHWEFEDEVRLITEKEKYQLVPQRVFLGMRATEYTFGMINRLVGGDIPVLRTKLGDNFKIELL